MKRIIAASVLAAFVFLVFPASTVSWEGRAAVGSTGIFPGRGMYGLSRVFSVGEIVEVYNPINETKVTVVISNNTDLSGILILLSPEAADSLGITAGSDSVVRVSKIPEYTLEPVYGNSAWSAPVADPDLQPQATVTSVPEPAVTEPVAVASTEVVTEPVAVAEVLPESEPVPMEETEQIPVIIADIPSEPTVPEEKPLETPSFVEPPPVIAEAEPAVPEAAEIVEYTETITYSLLPSEEKPPVPTEPAIAAVPDEPVKTVPVPVENAVKTESFEESTLKSGAYYVQLAFLRDVENVNNLVNRFKAKYPIAVNKMDSGFQVLVGPLAQTECNAVLSQFKNNGFKDSFVKKIK